MDTTRNEFIAKMKRMLIKLENGEFASEQFQDCEISAGIYGGTVSFRMGQARVELRLYRMTMDEALLNDIFVGEAEKNA